MASEQIELLEVDDGVDDSPSVNSSSNTQINEENDSILEKAEEVESSELSDRKETSPISPTVGSTQDEESPTPAGGKEELEDENLEQCLEPRPPHLAELEGSESPKDIHKKLMRKVNQMNSNGDTVVQQSSLPSSLEQSFESDHEQLQHEGVSPRPSPLHEQHKTEQTQKTKKTFSIFKRFEM